MKVNNHHLKRLSKFKKFKKSQFNKTQKISHNLVKTYTFYYFTISFYYSRKINELAFAGAVSD